MTLAIYPLKTHLKWTCYSYYKHTQERHSMAPNICTTLRWHHLRTRTHDCCVLYLLHDSLLIVVAQGATELVVVHGRTVLLHAPQPGNLSRGGGRKCLWLHSWLSPALVRLILSFKGEWWFACVWRAFGHSPSHMTRQQKKSVAVSILKSRIEYPPTPKEITF